MSALFVFVGELVWLVGCVELGEALGAGVGVEDSRRRLR